MAHVGSNNRWWWTSLSIFQLLGPISVNWQRQPGGRSPSTSGRSRVSPSLTRQPTGTPRHPRLSLRLPQQPARGGTAIPARISDIDNHPCLVLITGRWWSGPKKASGKDTGAMRRFFMDNAQPAIRPLIKPDPTKI
jgi:hypothetical protein